MKTVQTRTTPRLGTRGVNWSQDRRLQFIDFRLNWDCRLNRSDLTDFFGISVPQASIDIARYTERAPSNLSYDASSRTYVAAPDFHPLYPSSGPQQFMAQLLALDRGVLLPELSFVGNRPDVATVPTPSRNIDPQTLRAVVRAISERGKLEVQYQSITRKEPSWRFISPHAFGHDGMRWHVRAYCHLRSGFRDFVIGRILAVRGSQVSDVDPSSDVEWQTAIDLVLAPHPDLSPEQRHGIEVDYGMQQGRITMSCRHAMLYYTLRRLSLDDDGRPLPTNRQVIIANLAELTPFLPKPGQA